MNELSRPALLIALLLIFIPTPAFSADKSAPPALTDWFKEEHLVVETRNPDLPGFSRTEIFLNASGEKRIDIDSTDGHENRKETILLISGKWMATKDVPLESGYEINAVDGPELEAQFPLQLLAHLFKHGPESVPAHQAVNVTEATETIRISSGNAEATFPVPWTVTGVVERIRQELVRYDLAFTFSGDGETHTLHVSGSIENLPAPFALPDDFPLAGWAVHSLDSDSAPDVTRWRERSAISGKAETGSNLLRHRGGTFRRPRVARENLTNRRAAGWRHSRGQRRTSECSATRSTSSCMI